MPSSFWSRQNQHVLGRGCAGMEPVPFSEETPALTWTLAAMVESIPSLPTKSLAALGSRAGKDASPSGVSVHHGDLRTKEAPGSLCTRAQVKGAGEKRPADVAAFQEEPVWIPLLNFQTEGNAEKPKADFPIPPRSRLAQGKLGPGQPHRHALDRVRIQLDRGPQERPLRFDEDMPAADEKPFGIERLSSRRGELISARTGRPARRLLAETLPPPRWSLPQSHAPPS